MNPEILKEIINKAIENEFKDYLVYWLIIVVTSIIVSIIATLITSYLKERGKNLATKQDIQEITNKVESVKNEYKEHFSKFDRYNSKQFEIYNNLWTSLIELKFSADTLWDSATQKNLKDFSTKVSEAKKSIDTSSLLLENDDYRELNSLIDKFNDFRFGKGELIKLYSIKNKSYSDMNNKSINNISIENIINNNRNKKEQYDELIIKLKQKFIEQIKGNKKGD